MKEDSSVTTHDRNPDKTDINETNHKLFLDYRCTAIFLQN